VPTSSPPDLPPPTQIPPVYVMPAQRRGVPISVLLLGFLGFGALAVSEILGLWDYRRATFVKDPIAEWEHVAAAVGFGLLAIACVIRMIKLD
jgi:hypothetical protein